MDGMSFSRCLRESLDHGADLVIDVEDTDPETIRMLLERYKDRGAIQTGGKIYIPTEEAAGEKKRLMDIWNRYVEEQRQQQRFSSRIKRLIWPY